jgi:hypothetical protein
MNQKKRVCVLLCFCVLCVTALGELRDFVVIVTPVLNKNAAANFNKIANYFQENGYIQLAEVFRSYGRNGNGSGFVITDRQGENYIITNRHVIARAQSVNITISTHAGTDLIYKNCPIVYIDNKLDLAVLQFPGRKKIYKRGLKISPQLIKDGYEVWSAGYPALLSRPDWQFSKGTITNQSAAIPEMTDPQVSYIIRHSANITPGTSGGPLLIRDRTSPSGYSVIGINTWTVSGGQNNYFAIPSRNINVILQKAKRAGRAKQDHTFYREDLEKSCKLLAAELSRVDPDYNKASRLISYSFADIKGMESFITVVKTGDSTQREKWRKNFFFNLPIETMRAAIFVLFWNSSGGTEGGLEVEFKEIDSPDTKDFSEKQRVGTIFDINGTRREVVWAYESGHWYIVEMNLAQAKKAYGVDTPLLGSIPQGRIGIGVNSCIDIFSEDIEDNRYEIGLLLDIPILPYMSISTGFNFVASLAADVFLYPNFIQIPLLARVEYYFDLSSNVIDLTLIPFFALGLGLDFTIKPDDYYELGPFFKVIGRAGVEIRSNHLSLGIYITYFVFLTQFYTVEGWQYPLIGASIKYNL